MDGYVRLWSLETGKKTWERSLGPAPVWGVAFDASGQRLAAGGGEWDRSVPPTVWSTKDDGDAPLLLVGHRGGVASLAFGRGNLLMSGGFDGTLRCWSAKTGNELGIFRGHTDAVHGISLLPDGKTVISAGRDGVLQVWELAHPQGWTPIEGVYNPSNIHIMYRVWFSPTRADQLLSAGPNGYRLWDISKLPPRRLIDQAALQSTLGFSGDGKLALVTTEEGVALLEIASGKIIWKVATGPVHFAALSPDRKVLATCYQGDKGTKLWSVDTGARIGTLPGDRALVLSPDGKTLATSGHGAVHLWVLSTQRSLGVIKKKGGYFPDLAFSPDGKTLAIADDNHLVHLVDVASTEVTHVFKGHTDVVYAVAFTPDGKTLASGGWDGAIKLWDIATKSERVTLNGPRRAIWSLSFACDGQALAVGYEDLCVVWPAPKDADPAP